MERACTRLLQNWGGGIILMHDDNALCVKDLPVLLNSIREKNLRAVTVSELIGLRRAQSGKAG